MYFRLFAFGGTKRKFLPSEGCAIARGGICLWEVKKRTYCEHYCVYDDEHYCDHDDENNMKPSAALRSPMQPYRRRSENSRLQTSRRRSEISRLRSVWGDLCKGLTRIPDTNPLHKPLAETLAET